MRGRLWGWVSTFKAAGKLRSCDLWRLWPSKDLGFRYCVWRGAPGYRANMPWLGLWWVLLGGDTQPSLDGELAACILLPRFPNGDFQFSWVIPSPFPTVPEVFIVTQILGVILRLFGWIDTPCLGTTLCFLASVDPSPSVTPILGGADRRDETWYRPAVNVSSANHVLSLGLTFPFV